MAQLRARFTGNREIHYRWVGEIGSGFVVWAQAHPAAQLVGVDTWSDDNADARVPRKTLVALPAGLLVIDSERCGETHHYSAGVLTEDKGGNVDWSRARYIETRRVDRDPKNPKAGQYTIHVVEVDGARGEYREGP